MSEIDWLTTGTMLTGFGSILGAIAISIAALIGRNSIRDYRNEKVTARRFELAMEVSELAILVEESINNQLWLIEYFDTPIAPSDDASVQAQKKLIQLSKREDVLDQGKEGLAKIRGKFDQLMALKPAVRTVLSEDVSKHVDELGKQFILVEFFFSLATKGGSTVDPSMISPDKTQMLVRRVGESLRREMSQHIHA